MAFRRETLDIKSLLQDTGNPRLRDGINSNDNAIREIIRDQKDKIVYLAEDILEYGLDPSQALILVPWPDNPNKYVVVEGNRRLAAITLLLNPRPYKSSLSDSQFNKLLDLSKKFSKSSKVDGVFCVVYDDVSETTHWVELRHTGENKGRGLISWGAQEIRRHRQRSQNIQDPAMVLLDCFENEGYISPEIRKIVPITTLDRLIRTRKIQNYINIRISNNKIKGLKKLDSKAIKALTQAITQLAHEEVNVRELYSAEERTAYFSKLVGEDISSKSPSKSPTEETKKSDQDEDENPNNEQEEHAKKSKNKSKRTIVFPHSKNRDFLIPGNVDFTITETKINDIYQELKTLKVEEYPNAVSVLFRLLLEFSSSYFLIKNNILSNTQLQSMTLGNKIKKIAKYLQNHEGWSQDDVDPFKNEINVHGSMFAISNFHSYIHNPKYNPNPNALKMLWNNFEKLILEIWS